MECRARDVAAGKQRAETDIDDRGTSAGVGGCKFMSEVRRLYELLGRERC